jgi:hypothetical protein
VNNAVASSDGEDAFRIWVNRQPQAGPQMDLRGAVIKDGRYVLKTVTLTNYGDKKTGEIKKRELRFRTYDRRNRPQDGWDFDDLDSKTTWWCEDKEIERVLSFLQSDVARTGRYRVVGTDSPAGIVLDLFANGGEESQELAEMLIKHGGLDEVISLLSNSDTGSSVAQLAVVGRRRDLIRRLQASVQDPETTETQIQRLIGTAYWIFGGRYVGIADRRNLMPLDQHDIPLLGADGTLHIVELKGSNIRNLVRQHRNHWIVGDEINEAVGQVMSYVRAFDELGTAQSTYYENELGKHYDMRRVFATVVIGHPSHAREVGRGGRAVDERIIQQTIRTYNAHLSRIEVMTYKDLADTAERALAFENESVLSSPLEQDGSASGDAEREASAVDDDIWSDEPPF